MPKTQVKPILAPRGGLRYDIPADIIADTDMGGGQNVFMQEGLIKKRYGYITLGNNLPLAGPIIGIDQFYLFAGTDVLLAVTTKLGYYLASPTGTAYWETIMSNEVEDDCETTWTDPGANVTVADDTVDYKVDSTSQKITLTADFATGLAAYRDQSLGDKSAYSFVRLWIKSDIATAAGDIQFLIDDTAGCGSPKETLNVPALVAGTWTLVFLEASAPATKMNSIESLGINIATDNGAQVINIDDVRFVKSFGSSVAYDADLEDMLSADYIRKSTEDDVWWVMSNGVDVPQKCSSTSTPAVSDLGGSPPAARIVIEFKSHLLLMDTTESSLRCPQRVRWSDTANPEEWATGNASYVDLTGADWIQAAVKFKGDYIVVLKERSIWLGYATGDSAIFQFDQKVTGAGCAAPKTVESLGDEIIFLGWDDVYVFDGIDYLSVGESVRDEIFRSMKPAQIGKCFGVVVEEQKEYWLFVPSTGSDYCDTVWVFNYNLNKWTKAKPADTMSAFGYFEKQAKKTIGDLVGTIGQQTWRIGDRTTLASAPSTLFGDIDGYVYEYDTMVNNDNGTAIDAWFATKDFNPTNLMERWRLLRIDSYFKGNGLDIEYSLDKGASWTQINSFGASSDIYTPQSAYVKVDLLMCRLRCRNNEDGEHFDFSRMNLFWQLAGRRL